MLKPVLTRGDMRCVGATTYEEFRRYFEKDRALSRRFQKVDINEPSRDDAYAILLGLRKLYEDYHKVSYSDEILRRAVDLSAEHINERYLPDKAIDIMDEAGSKARIAAMTRPPELKVIEGEIEEIRVADEAIVPIPTTDYPTPAARPLNSRLDTRRLCETFGLVLPHWQQGVDRMLAEIL